MKKRKSFIGMGLLVAVLMLAVGYATISGINLRITGSANASTSSENFKVVFQSATPTDHEKKLAHSTASVVANIDSNDTTGHTATLSVSNLTTNGDSVTATYVIKNNSPELPATVEVGDILNGTVALENLEAGTTFTSDYFEIIPTFGTAGATPVKTTEIAAQGTATLTVTVSLIKTPSASQSATFTIPFTASPAE